MIMMLTLTNGFNSEDQISLGKYSLQEMLAQRNLKI